MAEIFARFDNYFFTADYGLQSSVGNIVVDGIPILYGVGDGSILDGTDLDNPNPYDQTGSSLNVLISANDLKSLYETAYFGGVVTSSNAYTLPNGVSHLYYNPSGVGDKIYTLNYLEYSYEPIGYSIFTTGRDFVNFNYLSSAELVVDSQYGDGIYDGEGGGDIVVLPNKAQAALLGFDLTRSFKTSSTKTDISDISGSDGSYNVVLGAGTDNVTINGNGSSTITGGDGAGFINLSGGGFDTIKLGSGIDTLSLSGSGDVTVDFTGGTTLDISQLAGFTGKLYIENFESSDEIDFSSLQDLTTSAVFNSQGVHSPGEFDVYSSSSQLATLIFDGTTDTAQLEPLDDEPGMGTKIILDTSNIKAVDPQILGSNVDWSFVLGTEGNELAPYVPNYDQPKTHSGVSIGIGVDLASGTISKDVLTNLFPFIASDPNLNLLYDAATNGNKIGPTLLAAVNLLKPPNGEIITTTSNSKKTGNVYHTAQSVSSSITQSQSNSISNASKNNALTNIIKAWNNISGGVAFHDLPGNAQTVLLDFSYQYGTNKIGNYEFVTDMVSATKTGDAKYWGEAAELLQDFGGSSPDRRISEANLLAKIPGASAPNLTTPQSGTASDSSNQTDYAFGVSSTDTSVAFDPPGETVYTLNIDSGSPQIASITLPESDAFAYSVRFKIGDAWSSSKLYAPLDQAAVPIAADAIEVTLLDAAGSLVKVATDFTFYVQFAQSGDFSGSIVAPVDIQASGLSGATVFNDANTNFTLNIGELSATTDANGDFILDGSGPIVAVGGTDILTNLPFGGLYYAPSGSKVVSELTTILEVVASVNNISISVANDEIVAALSLAAGTDLTTLNAEAGAASGNVNAIRALAIETNSMNTVTLVSAAGGGVATAAASADTAFVYSTSAFSQAGVASLAKFAFDSGVGSAVASVIGQISAAAMSLTMAGVNSGAPASQVIASIAAVAKVIQGAAATALAAAGSDATALVAVLSAYTGNNLATLASAAGGVFLSAPTLTVNNAVSSTFDGVVRPGATVALFDGSVEIGTVVADPVTGAFSFADLSLKAGEQTLTARVTNASSLFSLPSAPLLIAVGTSATIVGELDALEGTSGLAAIDLTDTHVLYVASFAALQALIANDAHALAAIQGGYSFRVTTSTSGADPVVSTNYDASGQLVSSTSAFYTDGFLTHSVTKEPDGSAETLTYTASVLVRDVIVHADQSSDTYIYGIIGQSYASEHDQSNPAGTLTLAERDDANGSIDTIYKAASDGSLSFAVYDTNENLTYQGFRYADGSSSFETDDVNHNVLEQSVTQVDQTRAVDKFTAIGQLYEHDNFAASGQLSLVALTGSDGSHTTFDYTGGQTLAATSPIRNSFVETGAGADTFVFNSLFGNDAITGFHAGEGANHDVLQLNSSIIPNYQALANMMVSVDNGADTVIKVDANNSVFLHNVTVTSLKSADFSFSHSA